MLTVTQSRPAASRCTKLVGGSAAPSGAGGGGTLSGTFLYVGTPPKQEKLSVTKDIEWINRLFDCAHIDRLNIGDVPTNRIQWNQPHEGNLFEFLYTRRSFTIAESA